MKRLIILFVVAITLTLQMIPFAAEASTNNPTVPLQWNAEYFNNPYLIGPAVVNRAESPLNFNWGTNSPAAGVPADNFSARWTSRPTLSAAKYRFSVTADDAVKITVDYINVVIDTTASPKAGQPLTADVSLAAGSHYIQIDFVEYTGNASINFTLTNLDVTVSTPPSTVPNLPVTPSAYVNVYALRLRSGPGMGYSIINTQPRYTVVSLLGRSSDSAWAKVALVNGTQGWMSTTYLVTNVNYGSLPVVSGGSSPAPVPVSQLAGTVRASALNVRSGPAVNYVRVSLVYENNAVTIVGRNSAGTWVQLRLANGALGWVNASYLNISGNVYMLPVTG